MQPSDTTVCLANQEHPVGGQAPVAKQQAVDEFDERLALVLRQAEDASPITWATQRNACCL